MTSITSRLPPELIILICQHLAADSSCSLLQLCLTSKQVHEIAQPILYSDIRLKSHYGRRNALLLFSNRVQPYAKKVNSLEIQLTRGHMSALLVGAKSAFMTLNDTVAMLPNLANLNTFIIQPADQSKKNMRLPDRVLHSMLTKLPASVRCLEIITNGLDQIGYDERRHVSAACYCDAIAKLLPQLHHLRLRKGYLCANALKTIEAVIDAEAECQRTPWPLQSITIRLDMDAVWADDRPTASSYCLTRDAATAPESIAKPLQRAIEAGLLPNLKQAIIISRFGRSNTLCTARKANHSGFAVYDAVRDSHTLIPVLSIEIEVGLHELSNPQYTFMKYGDLYLVRDVDGADRFATFQELLDVLEGNRSFRQVIGSVDTKPFVLDLASLRGRDNVAFDRKVRMALWTREKDTGQCLLTAQEIPGLGTLPNDISEVVPFGWMYGENTKKGEKVLVPTWNSN